MIYNVSSIKRQSFFTNRSTSFVHCPSKVKFRGKEKHVENWYGRVECCLMAYCVHALYFQEWLGTPKPQQPAFFGEPARRYDSSLSVCKHIDLRWNSSCVLLIFICDPKMLHEHTRTYRNVPTYIHTCMSYVHKVICVFRICCNELQKLSVVQCQTLNISFI